MESVTHNSLHSTRSPVEFDIQCVPGDDNHFSDATSPPPRPPPHLTVIYSANKDNASNHLAVYKPTIDMIRAIHGYG